MPQLDERTPLQRLAARAKSEAHPARWDEESLEATVGSPPPGPASTPPSTSPPATPGELAPLAAPGWLSEPCGSVSLWHERLVPERFRGTRWDPGPRGVLVIAALGLLAILIAGYVALREEPVTQPVPPLATVGEVVPVDQDAPAPDTAGAPATPAPAAGAFPLPAAGAVPLPAAGSTPVPAAGAAQPPTSNPAVAQPGRNPLAPNAAGAPSASTVPGELVVSVVGLVEHGGLRRFPPGARVADALRVAAPRPEADLSTLNLAQLLTDGDQIIVARSAVRPTTPAVGTTIVNSAHPAANSPPSSASPRPPGAPAKVNLNTATESELDTLPGVGPVTAKAILTWRTRHGRFTSIDQLAEIAGIGHSRLNRLRDRVTV
ncbi:ComEA family DNA-binding protein [Nocardia sp. NPDC059240]|uniref:ComEA family DNA-binding protein n=1 Tax=Nocardia sp. NPDC059240 TaxID=3346786 RepID=UPI003682C83B